MKTCKVLWEGTQARPPLIGSFSLLVKETEALGRRQSNRFHLTYSSQNGCVVDDVGTTITVRRNFVDLKSSSDFTIEFIFSFT